MMLIGLNESYSTKEEIRNVIRSTIMYKLETVDLNNVGPEDMLWLRRSDFKYERTGEDSLTLYLSDMRSSIYIPRSPCVTSTQYNEREYNKGVALEISDRFKLPFDTCLSAVSKHCDLIRDRYIQLKNEYNPSDVTLDNIGLKILDEYTYTITNKVADVDIVEKFKRTVRVYPDYDKYPALGFTDIRFSKLHGIATSALKAAMKRGYCKWVPPETKGGFYKRSNTWHPMYRYWSRAVNRQTPHDGLELHCSWKVSLHRLIRDVGLRPYKQYLTMYNPDKGFVPGNVYWRKKFTNNDIVSGTNKDDKQYVQF